MRGLRELWKISEKVYREIVFRSTLYQRGITSIQAKDIEKLSKQLKYTGMYKILMLIMSAFYALFGSLTLQDLLTKSGGTELVQVAFFIAAYILMNGFILFFLGIVQSSMIFTPEIYYPISILDLSWEELSRIMLFAYLRIFDVHLIGSIALTLALFGFITKNVILSILTALGLSITYMITLWIILYLAKTYLYKFASPELSASRLIIKIIAVLGYALIFAVAYLIPTSLINYLPGIIDTFLALDPVIKHILIAIPPLNYAYFTAQIIYLEQGFSSEFIVATISTALYIGLSLIALRKTLSIFKKLTIEPPARTTYLKISRGLSIRTRGIFKSILIKDFKIMIRNPNTALFLLLGPAMYLTYLIVSIAMKMSPYFLSSMAMFIVVMHPMMSPGLMQIEGKTFEYVMSLPIRMRDIIKSKAILMTISYISFAVIAFAHMTFAIGFKILTLGLIINTCGVFAANYKAIDKLIKMTLKGDKGFIDIQKDLLYLAYLIGITFIYCIIPIILLILAETMREISSIIIIVLIILQAIYLASISTSK